MCDLITMMNLGFHERKRECLRLVCVKNNSMREERRGVGGLWFLRMPLFVGGFGSFNCISTPNQNTFFVFYLGKLKHYTKNENSLLRK